MLVSLETVPRNAEALAQTAGIVRNFPSINTVNIPDLLRLPLRSWDASVSLAAELPDKIFIPHIRAIDFDMKKPFPLAGLFHSNNISTILVIAGDPPEKAASHKIYPTETVPFIKKLKKELPETRIYAAFDPYRSNIRYEFDYLRKKEDAGAIGFMSQPFFDLRLLEIYAEYLEGKEVFWGVSPVVLPQSRNYWETRNRAVFPKSFEPAMEWNVRFGRQVINFCKERGFNLYLMPIKVDVPAYLAGLFGGEA
ncbi:MAG: methylenetetrahydrofolate reductase [Treponema sp.]|jgi:methylenetetrahydrofolate reductase (NADPH)|nr:methylenetetrahydrofolate reductase [Treponema sp.]